jgi:tRNA-modifying protein YgfZ
MNATWQSVPLDSLGVLRARGADVRSFLQGQLSNDMARLTPQRALLAGYHNPQGRVIALLRLVQLADDDLLAVLPRELVAGVAGRLSKFILRAKVKLSDESGQWQAQGLTPRALAEAAAPWVVGEVTRSAEEIRICITAAPARFLQLRQLAAAAPAAPGPGGEASWQLAAIAAGEPQVHGVTSEEFVAQMLNLDVLGAIAFEKGCYTGQEVIARAHYRGRVKRRMQRFLSQEPVTLQPGDRGTLEDGRAFQVVQAAQYPDGRCEFLAVCTLPHTTPATAEGPAAPGAWLKAATLELPYALGD